VKPLRVVGFPLVALALWIEVYALVIQGATDACSFGYCALGHGGTVAAPHGLAALIGSLAVLLLVGGLVLDRRLSRPMPAKPTPAWTHFPVTVLIAVLGVAAWFAALSFLTWGQPFAWVADPGPCVAPPDMNLTCDTETSAQLFHDYGRAALAIAAGAGVLVIGALLGARSLVSRLWGTLRLSSSTRTS
jgi:hypothetical protein